MSDRNLRTVVTGLTGLLVLVIAVTLLIMVGRSGSGDRVAEPHADRDRIALRGRHPDPARKRVAVFGRDPRSEPQRRRRPSPSAAPSGSPGATAPATLTFVGLKLDATDDPGGEPRIVTFRSDGAGTVTAKLATTSPQGTTHMCFLVGTKEIGCKDWSVGHVHREDQPGACQLDGHAPGQRGGRPEGRPDGHVPGRRPVGQDRARAVRRHRRPRNERHQCALQRSGRRGGPARGGLGRSPLPVPGRPVRRERRAGEQGPRKPRTRNHRPIPTRHCPSRREPGGSCSRTPRQGSGRPT